MPKLRVGIVDYLNSKPLAWGLLKGHDSDLFVPTCHSPAEVARLLAAGQLEVGLVPVIELQRQPGLSVVPDLCIASEREVLSVLLVSREPFEGIRRVALDASSRTSVVLTRILLERRFGLSPVYEVQRPDLEAMLSTADAALIIGDPALRVPRDRYHVLDLAAAWRKWTGLPFVFAVWAVREGVELPRLGFYFESSYRYGLASLDGLVRETSAELDLAPETVASYLTEHLSYVLREPERRGMERFFREAVAVGAIPEVRPIRLWEEVDVGRTSDELRMTNYE